MNYNGTTNVSGQATLALPLGNCHFRADKGGVQWVISWLVMRVLQELAQRKVKVAWICK
jgi:hypothetical protein